MIVAQNGWMLGAFGGSSGPATVTPPERTRYVAANVVADITLGSDGDQAIVMSGNLRGAIFENVAGVMRLRGQQEQPMRTTVYPPVQRDLIGSLLPAGDLWWYVLTTVDGTSNPGWYSIDENGIQDGPVIR